MIEELKFKYTEAASKLNPPDGFILDRGRIPEIRARIEEEVKSSGRGWLWYQLQEGGMPQSKDKSKATKVTRNLQKKKLFNYKKFLSYIIRPVVPRLRNRRYISG